MQNRGVTLREFLDPLYSRYHQRHFLSSDPLEFVYRYSGAMDQEVVALVSALLAYGNVKQIRRSVEAVLSRIAATGLGPAAFVRRPQPKALEGFVHRFNRGEDLTELFRLVAESWERFGSVGAHFLTHLEPGAPDISGALNGLIGDWRQWRGGRTRDTFDYLLTAPRDGSCCKRWCMFLRWMGRDDDLDPGLWTAASPLAPGFPAGRALRADQLVIPLDTHTGRISQYLGLTKRKTLDWKAAVEVTAALRQCHKSDPVRYDFALSRLGILDVCKRAYRREICENCELLPACGFARRESKKARTLT